MLQNDEKHKKKTIKSRNHDIGKIFFTSTYITFEKKETG
jgi:hypothetical protein